MHCHTCFLTRNVKLKILTCVFDYISLLISYQIRNGISLTILQVSVKQIWICTIYNVGLKITTSTSNCHIKGVIH